MIVLAVADDASQENQGLWIIPVGQFQVVRVEALATIPVDYPLGKGAASKSIESN